MTFKIWEEKEIFEIGANKNELTKLVSKLPILCRYPDYGSYSYYFIVKKSDGTLTFIPFNGYQSWRELMSMGYHDLHTMFTTFQSLEILPDAYFNIYTGNTKTTGGTLVKKQPFPDTLQSNSVEVL